MLDELEARVRILDAVTPAAAGAVVLRDALGCFAAKDVLATIPLPRFDNSQMDGYAVRARDAISGARLKVAGEQPAGPDLGLELDIGEAIRIFTGAPMPAGADAVVMQEDTKPFSKGHIRVNESSVTGEFVRRKGSDLCEGQKILSVGDPITPAMIGVLASQGLTKVDVRPLQVSVVTTGDELIEPGKNLPSGAIFNSNGPMLASAVRDVCVAEVSETHAPDDKAKLTKVLQAALTGANVCLIAGGVSVGDHDHVKAVLADIGVEGGFWQVRVKPGKPLFFGKRGEKLVFGLPGNPVSAYITFQLFVAPALRKMAGALVDSAAPPLPVRTAELLEPVANDRGDRPHYFRGWFDAEAKTFRPIGMQQSHALFALSRANALLRVDAHEGFLPGMRVDCLVSP